MSIPLKGDDDFYIHYNKLFCKVTHTCIHVPDCPKIVVLTTVVPSEQLMNATPAEDGLITTWDTNVLTVPSKIFSDRYAMASPSLEVVSGIESILNVIDVK